MSSLQTTSPCTTLRCALHQRQCGYRFPGAFTSNISSSAAVEPVPDARGVNSAYKGWNTTTERLVFANGISASRPFSYPIFAFC